MIRYYISASNITTVRVKPLCGNPLDFEAENLYTFEKETKELGFNDFAYNKFQSMLTFAPPLDNPKTGEQYRLVIKDGSKVVWNGSLEVFTSQSIDKVSPANQIPLEEFYISNETDNEFIIL
jgi:hypothetical protein